MENKDYCRQQESIYLNNGILIWKVWYRRILGGEWKLLKLGKDTPHLRLFCVWTKMDLECWSGGYFEVLSVEEYEYNTGVVTKYDLYKEILKWYMIPNIIKRFFKYRR